MSDHTDIDAAVQTPTAVVTTDRGRRCNVYRTNTIDARAIDSARCRPGPTSETSASAAAFARPVAAH